MKIERCALKIELQATMYVCVCVCRRACHVRHATSCVAFVLALNLNLCLAYAATAEQRNVSNVRNAIQLLCASFGQVI